MAPTYHQRLIIKTLFAATVFLPGVAANGWDRQQCFANLNSTNSSSLNPAFFFPGSTPEEPILTVDGCEALCGDGMGIYSDSVPRLLTWFLPLILLVANMQFTNIGKKRLLMTLHLLGDPIDSTWSLLCKANDWNRCHSQVLARYGEHGKKTSKAREKQIKNLVIILSISHELFDSSLNIDEILDSLAKIKDSEELDVILYEHGSALRDGRTKEYIRTLFTIIFYIFQVVSAFVPAVGQAPSPSGGRIGPVMTLSWLLPIVLLSNAVGDFAPRRQCKWIVAHFLKRINHPPNQSSFCAPKPSQWLGKEESFTPYFDSLDWSGAIAVYRPSKRLRETPFLAFLALLPTTLAFGLAFAVLDSAPTYLSCRHLLVVGIYVFWLVSFVLTYLFSLRAAQPAGAINYRFFPTGKYLWHLILIKDAMISAPILAFIIASGCGMMNSCYCFSEALFKGRNNVGVALNPEGAFDRNDDVIYPAMVGTGFAMQILVFMGMLWVGWQGYRVMWWGEREVRGTVPNLVSGSEMIGNLQGKRTTDEEVAHNGEVREPSSLDIEQDKAEGNGRSKDQDQTISVVAMSNRLKFIT